MHLEWSWYPRTPSKVTAVHIWSIICWVTLVVGWQASSPPRTLVNLPSINLEPVGVLLMNSCLLLSLPAQPPNCLPHNPLNQVWVISWKNRKLIQRSDDFSLLVFVSLLYRIEAVLLLADQQFLRLFFDCRLLLLNGPLALIGCL